MQNYGIKSTNLTTLCMVRRKLITKEKMEETYKGILRDGETRLFYGSIFDDLERFFRNSKGQNTIKCDICWSFFTPRLTCNEMKLVKEKNKNQLRTYSDSHNADVDVAEMKKSASGYKFLQAHCLRKTISLRTSDKPTIDAAAKNNSGRFCTIN